jgi:hypothetical protein
VSRPDEPSRPASAARALAWLAGLLLSAAPSGGGPLDSATLTLRGDGFGTAEFVGVGATGTAASPSQASLGAGSAFTGTATVSLDGAPGLFVRIQLTKNDPGSFAGAPLAGEAPFRGQATLLSGAFPIGDVSFVVGEPTKHAVAVVIPTVGLKTTFGVLAKGWTTGTASFSQDPATAMGTNALSPNGAGTLTLVTPLVIGTSQAAMPVIGELHLTYAPEPGATLLLVWGGICLAAVGHARSRARSR